MPRLFCRPEVKESKPNLMRISLLRLCVILRRFRRSSADRPGLDGQQDAELDAQVDALLRRADPQAGWNERVSWMIDVARWLRREPRAARHALVPRIVHHQRTFHMLAWLERHPATMERVRVTLRVTLHEALGPDIFCATGLPREPAFFNELTEHVFSWLLPTPAPAMDLSLLFTAMFPEPADADWLQGLDQKTLARLWSIVGDDSLRRTYTAQIDEALHYLAMMVAAVGVGPDFRHRLRPVRSLKSTPFMELRDVLDMHLALSPTDCASLTRVRRLIAVCRAQTDRIYADLDEHGVSVGLVYHVERMRAQLTRMARLIDLRAAMHVGQGAMQLQELLVDLIRAHHERASVRSLVRRNFSFLARKMVERNASHGEHYIARDRQEYRAMLRAAMIGGLVTAMAALGKTAVASIGLAKFFEGLFNSLNFALSFMVISALGGVLATKQPAVTAPALAAKMVALDTVDGLRALMLEIACLLRSQAAAVFGNLVAVIPAMLALSLGIWLLSGQPLMTPNKANATIDSLSAVGVTPIFAAFTGVLLWVASLAAGFADNWFALRRLRTALAHQRRLVFALGPARAARWAQKLEDQVGMIVGNLALAVLLGMVPVLAGFFGLAIEPRHVTLSTASLAGAVSSLGWQAFTSPPVWLAMAGIVLIGLLNVGVAFSCALALALQARAVPRRVRRIVFRQVLKRFSASPATYLLAAPVERSDRDPH